MMFTCRHPRYSRSIRYASPHDAMMPTLERQLMMLYVFIFSLPYVTPRLPLLFTLLAYATRFFFL